MAARALLLSNVASSPSLPSVRPTLRPPRLRRSRALFALLLGVSVGAALLIGNHARAREQPLAPRQAWATTWVWHYVEKDAPIRLPVFERLLAVAPSDVDVLVAASDEFAVANARRALGTTTAGGRPIRYVQTSHVLGAWARDPYLFFDLHGDARALLPPRRALAEETVGNFDVPLALSATGPDLVVKEASFAIEGGDVFVTDHRVFVGLSTLWTNERYLGIAPNDLLSRLERELGRRVIVIGDSAGEPLHRHADMVFTALDDDTVVLGDPRLALPLFAERTGREGFEIELGEAGRFRRERQLSIAARYDAVARELEAEGLTVRRLPLLQAEAVGDGRPPVVLTWNNVLLHEGARGKVAFVPAYDVEPLDRIAHELWRSWGYAVQPISMRETIPYGGAVRCVTNVMRRPLR